MICKTLPRARVGATESLTKSVQSGGHPGQAGTLVSTAWRGGLGESRGLRGAAPSLSTAECLAWALCRGHLGTKNKFD